MAAIVLAAAAGSAASSLGAGTFLAALAAGAGGYLGGFVDRSIFGGKARINQEGSRLTELMVQASTYGKSIPVVYGNARIAGNVIWSRPIQEHVTTTTQSSGGGKGGNATLRSSSPCTSAKASSRSWVAILSAPAPESTELISHASSESK